GAAEKLDLVTLNQLLQDSDGQPSAIAKDPSTLALVRELLVAQNKGKSPTSSPMIPADDLYFPGIIRQADSLGKSQAGKQVVVVSASRLLDNRLKVNPGALRKLLDGTKGVLYFAEPRGRDFGFLTQHYGEMFAEIGSRFVSSSLKELDGVKSAVLLLDAEDQKNFQVGEEKFLSPISLGNVQEAFVVPLNAETDMIREVSLGMNLAAQGSLGQLESLDPTTRLLLVEVAQGFGRSGELVMTVQSELAQAVQTVTTVLKGL
ncbi:MAG: hypothetical protein ABH845_06425, partial [Candidatus Omnitrophota bacterium]